VAGIDGVPPATRRLFATALEIEPKWHLRMQAAFQRHCCNAVSKTINLPESATPDDVAAIYCEAWKLGLKGVTVYRYNSKSKQVMNVGNSEDVEEQCTGGSCPRCADG
jgi:ribonucleoside-diphosphate reductase alpha chain